MPAADRAYALTMRDSSGIRWARDRCSVSGVCKYQKSNSVSRKGDTYTFRGLYVVLYYAAHALELWAHFGAKADKLDRVAEAHLAFWVHEALLDELLALERPRSFDLQMLVLVRGVVCCTYMLQPLLVVFWRIAGCVLRARGIRGENVPANVG